LLTGKKEREEGKKKGPQTANPPSQDRKGEPISIDAMLMHKFTYSIGICSPNQKSQSFN